MLVEYGGERVLVTAKHVVEDCLDGGGTVDAGVYVDTEIMATFRDVAVFRVTMQWGRGILPEGLPLLPQGTKVADIEQAWMYTYRESREVSGNWWDDGFGRLQVIHAETIDSGTSGCILFDLITFGGQSGSPFIDEYGRVVAILSEAHYWEGLVAGQRLDEMACAEHHGTLHETLSLAIPQPVPQIQPTPIPNPSSQIEEQCFTLLDAVDQERIAEAQERGRRWPARLARDDMVAACAHAVRQGLGDVETIVAQFADTDFSTNLNAYGATSEEKPTPTPTPIPPTPKPEPPRDDSQDTPDESDVQDSPADTPAPETPDPRIAIALDAYNAAVKAEEQARRAWVSAKADESAAKAAYNRAQPDCDWILGFEQCDYTDVDRAKADWDAAKAATQQALRDYRAAQRDTKAAYDAYQSLL